MNHLLKSTLIGIVSIGSLAHAQSTEAKQSFLDGSLYTRLAVSYEAADSYHSGYNSFASAVFENFDGEYTFYNYTADFVYISPIGIYIGTGIYSSVADVETNGLGLGVPNTNSGLEPREIPLAIGYDTKVDQVKLRFEGRFIFNIDDDFNNSFASAASNAVLLPVTDGSDSFTFSVKAKTDYAGFEHSLLLGYQMYENGVSHPIFPSFSLGDRLIIDYELSKVIGDFRVSVGHLYSKAQQTEGTPPTGIPGVNTAYLTEKPQYVELRLATTYRATNRFFLDGGFKYTYDGKDAPKQKTVYLGAAYLF